MRRPRFQYLPAVLILLITALLTAFLGMLYVQGIGRSAKEDFYALTGLTTQIFAESIRAEMTEEQLSNITRSFVRGDVLYAAVVIDGDLRYYDRIDAAAGASLSPEDFDGTFTQSERTLPNGTPYLDVIRPFLGSSSSFVRIGFSMREIENRVLSETLFVIQIGLGILIFVGILIGLFYWLTTRRAVESPVSSSEPDSQDFVPVHQGATSNEVEATPAPHRVIEAGPLSIDLTSKSVSVKGDPIELSPKEFDLVTLLAGSPGKVFSNDEILENVWADGFSATSKDVKQYIYLLRRKLESDPEKPTLIVTVRGFGYKLESEENNVT